MIDIAQFPFYKEYLKSNGYIVSASKQNLEKTPFGITLHIPYYLPNKNLFHTNGRDLHYHILCNYLHIQCIYQHLYRFLKDILYSIFNCIDNVQQDINHYNFISNQSIYRYSILHSKVCNLNHIFSKLIHRIERICNHMRRIMNPKRFQCIYSILPMYNLQDNCIFHLYLTNFLHITDHR